MNGARSWRVGLWIAGMAVAGLASNAPAAVLRVNSVVDAVDAVPGDGTCSTGRLLAEPPLLAHECTLRAAVQETAARAEGDVEIHVPAGTYRLSLRGLECEDDEQAAGRLGAVSAAAQGDLDVSGPGSVAVIGAGRDLTIVEAVGTQDRVFDLWPGTGFRVLRDLIVRGGRATSRGCGSVAWSFDGGGVNVRRKAFAALQYVDVRGNSAERGGGLAVYGWLTTLNSLITANVAREGGGVLISGNADLIARQTTVSDNTALLVGGRGGGLAALHYSSAPLLWLIESTISGNNVTNGNGGGIYSAGTLAVDNSTVSGNVAGLSGGGLYVARPTFDDQGFGGRATVTLSTIAQNRAGVRDGGVYMDPLVASQTFVGTLIAGNRGMGGTRENCGPGTFLQTGGHNLEDRNDCGFDLHRDLVGRAPLLGPLADNGGPTRTHALQVGSWAIDAGPPADPFFDTDQRGVARPHGRANDVGAYEFDGPQIIGGVRIPPTLAR
jgi:hypothetical protein